ncbi:MAG: hypothetical protein IKM31_04585 [Oscillospiraceae bacterium]|nr:hypothetical protein [Oscillospiraceae bacterium]
MVVLFSQCDPAHRLKMSELFMIMTNMADNAFAYRGMTHQQLVEEMQAAFLLSQVSVQVYKMPIQNEILRVATWEGSCERARFLRNFCIWNKETGELLVEAASSWMLVNPYTRQILRPSSFAGQMFPIPEEKSGAPEFKRIRMKEEDEGVRMVGMRPVLYSDLDGNGHVDNARYIEMAADILSDRMIKEVPKTLQVQFAKEAVFGETMAMYRLDNGNEAVVKGSMDGKDNFICAIEF